MKIFVSTLVAAGLLLLGGCKQDADELDCPAPAKGVTSLAAFTAEHSAPTQTFRFDAGQAQTLRTAQGATVRVLASSFQLPGGAVATGPVELRLREIYSPGEMLLANLPTMSWTGDFLESGGEFQVTAWQGSTRLQLRPGRAVVLATPAPTANFTSGNPDPMTLWTLTDSSNVSSWVGDTTRVQAPALPTTTAQQVYSFPIWRDSLGWYNVDRVWPLTGAPRTTVSIGTGPQTTDTRVYLISRPFNALLRPNFQNGAWQLDMLPVGQELTAVVLQLRGDQLYFGSQRATVTANLRLNPPLEALDPAEVARRIRQL